MYLNPHSCPHTWSQSCYWQCSCSSPCQIACVRGRLGKFLAALSQPQPLSSELAVLTFQPPQLFHPSIMNQIEIKALSILPQTAIDKIVADFKVFSEAETKALVITDIESPAQLREIELSQEAIMATECREITTPFVLKDQFGNILLGYYPGRIPRDAAETAKNRLRGTLRDHFTNLSLPRDTRHRDIDVDELESQYGSGNFGTIRCACWFEEGREKSEIPLVNKDMCKGSMAFDKHARLIQVLAPVKSIISEVLAGLSPSKWRNLVSHCHRLERYVPATSSLFHHPHFTAWSSFSLLVNTPTRIHLDVKDAEKGLTGMCTIGSPCGVWLVIYSAGLKFRLDPEDIAFLNSNILPHYIYRTGKRGRRFAVVSFFNHQGVLDWVSAKHAERKACFE